MIDGLWTVEFGSNTGMFGSGVAVFQGGKILGGDNFYYYTGDYSLSGNALRATLTICPFIQGAQSVFRTVGKIFTLELIGSIIAEGQATAQGRPREMPGLNFGVKLVKRA
jgi:T3SS negative regulator,GrlR